MSGATAVGSPRVAGGGGKFKQLLEALEAEHLHLQAENNDLRRRLAPYDASYDASQQKLLASTSGTAPTLSTTEGSCNGAAFGLAGVDSSIKEPKLDMSHKRLDDSEPQADHLQDPPTVKEHPNNQLMVSRPSEASRRTRPSVLSGNPTRVPSRLLRGDSITEEERKKLRLPKYRAPIFRDADSMKRLAREKLVKKPTYQVSDFYKNDGYWQQIARHNWFENVTFLVIAFNALWIAVDTDYNDQELLVKADIGFQLAEHFFCLYFTVELLIRFMAFDKKCYCLQDGWFVFDLMLVVMMVTETWVISGLMYINGTNTGGGAGQRTMSNASVLRIAKFLRLMRMTRMARLFRAVTELRILIMAMMAAARSVFFTLALLCIIVYVFAVICTQLLKGTFAGEEHFGTVIESMRVLYLQGTLLDNIVDLMITVEEDSMFTAIVIHIFILLTAITTMNILIGVLCEVITAVAATEKEVMEVNYVRDTIEVVLKQADEESDGLIDKKNFQRMLESREAVCALNDVGVDVGGLVDFADIIFEENLDDDSYERELSVPEFMEIILQFRGSNTAKVKDIVDLRKLVTSIVRRTEKMCEMVSMDVNGLRGQIAAIPKDGAVMRMLGHKDKIEKAMPPETPASDDAVHPLPPLRVPVPMAPATELPVALRSAARSDDDLSTADAALPQRPGSDEWPGYANSDRAGVTVTALGGNSNGHPFSPDLD